MSDERTIDSKRGIIAPAVPESGHYVWGEERYATRAELLEAIAGFCADALCEADACSVQLVEDGELQPAATFAIEITARLVRQGG